MLSVVFIFIGIFFFLHLSKFYQFTFLSLSALLPFTFGNLGSIPRFLFIEWITLTAFLVILYELAPPYFAEKKLHSIKFKGAGIFLFALAILAVWTIISILNNEILTNEIIFNNEQTGTKRLYFNIFNNILLFFTTAIFASVYYKEIDFEKFFKILLFFAISIGVLRIITYFIGIKIPFLSGIFEYGGEFSAGANAKYGGTAYRFGGLTDVVILGIPALFALNILKGKISIFGLVILLIFLFFSGGRTVMIGVIFSLLCFSFLFYPKNFIYFIVAGVMLFVVIILFLPENTITGQVGRLTYIRDEGFLGQDAWRGTAWKLYLENFSNSPVFGKGISSYSDYFYSSISGTEKFARAQQFSGGHGSYFSLLSTFGLGGLLYFGIMVFGGIYVSFRKIIQNNNYNLNKTAIAVFAFILLLTKSFDFFTGSNGLTVPILFYIVGLIISMTVMESSKIDS